MGAQVLPDAEAGGTLVERLRGVHLEMVDAVLAGDGLQRVAELAAESAGGPVAIVVPRIGIAALAPAGGAAAKQLDSLRSYVGDRLKDRPAQVPAAVAAEVPVAAGDDVLGAVLLLADEDSQAAPTRPSSCTSRPSPRSPRSPSRRPRRRSSRTCAARSWRTCARARTSSRARSCAAPGGWAATSRAAPSCCAPS